MTLIDTIPIYTPSPIAIIITLALGMVGIVFSYYKNPRIAKIVSITACTLMIINSIILIAGGYNIHNGDRYVVILDKNVPSSFFNDYTLIKSYDYSEAILIERKDK